MTSPPRTAKEKTDRAREQFAEACEPCGVADAEGGVVIGVLRVATAEEARLA